MPTQTAILKELAARYGGCDPASPDEVARFYEQRFRKLSRRERDRISFEILHRDGESVPAASLSPDEVQDLDALFENEEESASSREPNRTVVVIRRLALGQAGFSIALFGAVGSVRLLPELIPSLGHSLLGVVEVVLVAVGLLGNGAAFFFERRLPGGRKGVESVRANSD